MQQIMGQVKICMDLNKMHCIVKVQPVIEELEYRLHANFVQHIFRKLKQIKKIR